MSLKLFYPHNLSGRFSFEFRKAEEEQWIACRNNSDISVKIRCRVRTDSLVALRANDGRTEVLDYLFAGVDENALGMEPDADVRSIPIADAHGGFAVVVPPRGLDESERKRLRVHGEGVVATHLERVGNAESVPALRRTLIPQRRETIPCR